MDTLKIRTPEGIEFSLPLAGPVSRMVAFAVDIGVVITIGSVAKQVLGPLAIGMEHICPASAAAEGTTSLSAALRS